MCDIIQDCKYDLNQSSDSVLKNKLNELIKHYKLNKTKSTNLKMSIILTDDIPACQKSHTLSFFRETRG